MSFRTAMRFLTPRAVPHRPPAVRLRVEPLEDRSVPAGFVQTNLASDVPGTALVHDPELVDAWGISINPAGTFWVSARATDVSTVYSGDVSTPGGFQPFIKRPLTVTIPEGKPTGQVFNGSDNFQVSAGGRSAPARFIFASETGHITAWNPGVPTGPVPPSRTAFVMASTPGAVYTGLAIDSLSAGTRLYAADFAGRTIDVFDASYAPTTLEGDFTDPGIPADYAPFNIWELGGQLYVAYAKQTDGDALPDGGHGFVSSFDFDGNFLGRVVSKDHLKEPWGLALAPAGFGEFGGALLVGNLGNGKINAYDPDTGEFLGRLADETGEAIHIDGLLGLHFGNGTVSGDRDALYFAAAPKNHQHGLFGSLRVAPEDGGGGSAATLDAVAPDGEPRRGSDSGEASFAPPLAPTNALLDFTGADIGAADDTDSPVLPDYPAGTTGDDGGADESQGDLFGLAFGESASDDGQGWYFEGDVVDALAAGV